MQTARHRAAEAWVGRWCEHVRNADYEAARRMFSEQVIGFGTRHDHLDGLAELERTQWRDVWEETSGFEVRVLRVLGEDPVVVVGLWSSTLGRGGSGAIRRGRITIVLEPGPTDLVALHTHVSLAPEGDAIR